MLTRREFQPTILCSLVALLLLSIAAPSAQAQQIQADFAVSNDWSSGYVAEIKLTNVGQTPVSDWTLEFDLGGQLVNLWNGNHSVDTTHHVVRNLSWNGNLAPNASAVVGFQIAYSGTRPEPTSCIFNGRACTFNGDPTDPGPNPPPPPPPPPVPSGDFVVEWDLVDEWNTGHTVEVRIFNDSNAPLENWDLQFDLGGSIGNAWNVALSISGALRTASGAAWNASIPAGGFISFGFVGAHTGETPEPTSCQLNGQTCVFTGVSGPPPPTEPQPLQVSIAAPLNGATVANTASILATVEGQGVSRVDFLLDGTLLGADTTAPYSFSWLTTTAADGSHTLTAQAFGATATAQSEPVNVIVSQPPPPPPPTGEEGFLSMSGSTMIDSDGNPVRLTGVNWFGFETSIRVVHGLWSRDYRSMLHQVHDMGFNALRIPFSNAILEPGSTSSGITFSGADPYDGRSPLNQPLQGRSTLEILDLIIEEAGRLGLKIILDNHSRKPDNFLAEGLWYLPDFPESRWIGDWRTLALRYRDNSTVVAFDLHNEPHNEASWGGPAATDWASAAERAAAEIHSVHPEIIVIVGGVQTYNGITHWWGGNLRGVRDRPLTINPSKLLYSAHDYGPEVFAQTWFSAPNYPDNLISLWDETWGYIPSEGIGGVFIGEFGIKEQTAFGGRALQWIETLLSYMGGSSSWTFWSLNPNSGDTGGVLQDDWVTPQQWKVDLLTPYQAEQFPIQP